MATIILLEADGGAGRGKREAIFRMSNTLGNTTYPAPRTTPQTQIDGSVNVRRRPIKSDVSRKVSDHTMRLEIIKELLITVFQ